MSRFESGKVCLTGATTDNLDIYRPGSDPEIQAPGKAIAEVAALAEKEATPFFPPLLCLQEPSHRSHIVYVIEVSVYNSNDIYIDRIV